MSWKKNARSWPNLNLPPPEMRKFLPERDGLLPTPLDDRGLVDKPKLIQQVIETVDDSFDWRSNISATVHHTQWKQANYPNLPDAPVNPRKFRELPINRLILPGMIHNLIHDLTEEPPVPPDEVMQDCIDSCRSLGKLILITRSMKHLERKRYITPERLDRGIKLHLESFQRSLEDARKIPSEFQLFDLSGYSPSNIEEVYQLAGELGKVAASNSISYTRVANAIALRS